MLEETKTKTKTKNEIKCLFLIFQNGLRNKIARNISSLMKLQVEEMPLVINGSEFRRKGSKLATGALMKFERF